MFYVDLGYVIEGRCGSFVELGLFIVVGVVMLVMMYYFYYFMMMVMMIDDMFMKDMFMSIGYEEE